MTLSHWHREADTADIGFLLIFPNIEAVRFGKDFPTKSADFIARRVGSVLFKFSTLNPLCGERCSPEQNPSTTRLAKT